MPSFRYQSTRPRPARYELGLLRPLLALCHPSVPPCMHRPLARLASRSRWLTVHDPHAFRRTRTRSLFMCDSSFSPCTCSSPLKHTHLQPNMGHCSALLLCMYVGAGPVVEGHESRGCLYIGDLLPLLFFPSLLCLMPQTCKQLKLPDKKLVDLYEQVCCKITNAPAILRCCCPRASKPQPHRASPCV